MNKRVQDFQFDHAVSDQFDDMLLRSIPFYKEIIRMTSELCEEFYIPQKTIYDLGCSTGILAHALKEQFKTQEFLYAGIDKSQPMLDLAQKRLGDEKNISFLQDDITSVSYKNAGIIVSNFTLQFLRPMQRGPLLSKIHNALPPNGVFLMAEKVLEENSDFSRLYVDLYYRFKQRNGYSQLEIATKRERLENVLIPYRIDENLEMLKEAGFSKTSVAFKWYNFALFIALRHTDSSD